MYLLLLNSTVATVACIVIGASDVAWVTDACCCWVQSTVRCENLEVDIHSKRF